MRQRVLLPAMACCLWLLPSALLAHKDDYLGDTFVYQTLARRELELEYWLDIRRDPSGGLHTIGAEYGFTDHLMGDISVRWFQREGGPLAFEQGFLELRYRFSEENRHFVDTAVSVEYEIKRSPDGGGTHRLLEPRLVLSRDVGGWNFTVNLFYVFVLDQPKRSTLEAAAGLRTPNFGRWSAGLEFRRELALENETLVLPQARYRVGDEAYIKVGVGQNLAGERDVFARLAFEFEF